MKIPRLPAAIDERFLNHRLRSTSLAGMISTAVALCLFLYRYYVDGVLNWDLFSIGVIFVVVKWAVLIRYRLTE